MDPLTHYLSGKLTQHLFVKEQKKRYISIFLLGAVFPDVDYVTRLWGMATYLKYHRGITHSFVGIAILSAILAYFFSRREKGNYCYLFSLAYLGMFIHIMLDWTNSYGTQLYLPFSDERAALDSIFIIDIYILAICIVALIVTLLLKNRRRMVSLCFTLVTVVYILTKIIFNHMVVAKVEKIPVPAKKVSTAAFPDMFKMNRFKCVIDTKDKYYTLDYELFNDGYGDLYDTSKAISGPKESNDMFPTYSTLKTKYGLAEYDKIPQNSFTKLANETYLGKVFIKFARYPLYIVQKDDGNTLVKITDVRYRRYSNKSGREGFTAKFLITDDMKIIKQGFRF